MGTSAAHTNLFNIINGSCTAALQSVSETGYCALNAYTPEAIDTSYDMFRDTFGPCHQRNVIL